MALESLSDLVLRCRPQDPEAQGSNHAYVTKLLSATSDIQSALLLLLRQPRIKFLLSLRGFLPGQIIPMT